MSLGTILIIVLVVLLFTTLPTWRYSANWGYVPSGVLRIAIAIILVMFVTGNI